MFLQHSYFSSKMLRFLLVLGLFSLSFAAKAQETVVDSTIIDTTAPYAVEAASDEEMEDEEEVAVEEETYVEPSLRVVPDSTVKRYKRDKAFEYANDPAYWTELQKKKSRREERSKKSNDVDFSPMDFSGVGGIINIFLLVALGALVAFLIYKLAGNRWPWQQQAQLKETAIDNAEELDVDELQLKIKESIEQKKFRPAIRYSYLFTLRRLDEKGWIRLDAKSTNRDYVGQMKAYDQNGTFSFLTNVYDYVWYGEFELNEEQFNIVYKDFQQYTNNIRH